MDAFPLSCAFARLASYAIACTIAACSAVSPAQSAVPSGPASFSFTVATIKPSDPNKANTGSSMGWSRGGSFAARSMSLKQLIEFTQEIGYLDVDQRIVGGPKWLGSTKFDIAAKCDEEAITSFAKMTEKQQIRLEQSMVQALLSNRFKLRTHHELRRLPVFVLVLAKDIPRMKPAADANPDEFSDTQGPPGNWRAQGVMMQALADDLSGLPEIGGKIVVDKTGLKGAFDFTLKWTPDPTIGADPAASGYGEGKSSPSAPSLLTALQEQLGLKLESSRQPVDVIVIDSAQWPTPN